MASPSSSAAPAHPAATVLVLRDGVSAPEIFMVKRREGTSFMGGAYVFPGGRVDPGDALADDSWCDGLERAARHLPDLDRDEAIALHVAAARELFEEAGVLLARANDGAFLSLADKGTRARIGADRASVHAGTAGFADIFRRERLRLALHALVPFARWVTPPGGARRFDARFFVTRLPPGQTPAHDDRETVDSAWMTASGALDRCRRDEIVLPPPTWTTLRELEPQTTVDGVLAWAASHPIVRREPLVHVENGARMLLLSGDPLNPEPPEREGFAETRFVSIDGRWRASRAD